jgi:hypothetical protein
MRIEGLLQFIVELAFLGIWALTSLLRRDHRPLPHHLTREPVLIKGSMPPRRLRFTIRGLMLAILAVAILLSLPLRFIVPLTFVAIWALTWLLTRDHQPLPPRPTHEPGGITPQFMGPVAKRRPRKRVRFTLKQLMLTVAILCVVLAGVKAYREWLFSRLAANHAREEARWSQSVGWWPAAKKLVDYHSRRKRMYEQANFLTIIPDESEPWASLPPPPAPTPITPPRPIPPPRGPWPVSGDP